MLWWIVEIEKLQDAQRPARLTYAVMNPNKSSVTEMSVCMALSYFAFKQFFGSWDTWTLTSLFFFLLTSWFFHKTPSRLVTSITILQICSPRQNYSQFKAQGLIKSKKTTPVHKDSNVLYRAESTLSNFGWICVEWNSSCDNKWLSKGQLIKTQASITGASRVQESDSPNPHQTGSPSPVTSSRESCN